MTLVLCLPVLTNFPTMTKLITKRLTVFLWEIWFFTKLWDTKSQNTALILHHMTSKVWAQITNLFPNFNGRNFRVWELIHPELYNGCNYSPILWLKLIRVSERGPYCAFTRSSNIHDNAMTWKPCPYHWLFPPPPDIFGKREVMPTFNDAFLVVSLHKLY